MRKQNILSDIDVAEFQELIDLFKQPIREENRTVLSAEEWDAMIKRLESPQTPNKEMCKLLARASAWETQ